MRTVAIYRHREYDKAVCQILVVNEVGVDIHDVINANRPMFNGEPIPWQDLGYAGPPEVYHDVRVVIVDGETEGKHTIKVSV